ncbi:DUF5686 and carboxypeptidase regulatory-like domain-containing protein [Labilibaculum antarcticum]|uniref:Membrane receptor RagA n=1 Tax=Labilibaculum antarcticum TaxID=1717717 RepID=A0A1Y1CEH7_9BACT|nr:DUF5686 and carboxypeptidase regulatory-like domain-containing protein [Labilibaculum antarcticum]BAX78769.1 hypothetical protein ALGA_0374 [Labilibaculum antarcticum]
MTKHLLLFLFCLLSFSGYSQQITGTISDTDGNAIPFANIYSKTLATGTTSNIDGQYQLVLPKGEWDLEFRYLGFKTKEVKVSINDKDVEMNVALAPQTYQLKEVKVLASGEDPAYYVMRKAIAMGDYYTKQVSEYDNTVYLKGSGKITSVPWLFKKKLAEDDITENKTFVTENISKIHFELPDKIEEEVVSFRSSGLDDQANPMPFITSNLYDTKDQGLISPLDKNALSVYRYELVSVFEDQGRMINRIKVIPRRKGKDLFRGYLNIAENYWNIHSADLQVSLPMTEISMHQLYAPVSEGVWMPVSFDFDIQFKALGFGLNGIYVASIKDYKIKLNPNIDHDYLKQQELALKQEAENINELTNQQDSEVLSVKEKKRKDEIQNLLEKDDMNNSDMRKLYRLMEKENQQKREEKVKEPLEIKIEKVKMAKDAKDKDSLYWTQMRPIPLSDDEKISFTKKDSLQIVRNSPEYKDSVRTANRKFKFKNLLFGKTYKYEDENSSFSTPGLLNIDKISFNTVQGFTYKAPFEFQKWDTIGHHFSLIPSVSYAFSRKHVDFSVESKYRYNGFKRAWIGIKAGSEAVDFNQESGINPMLNDISSLYFRDNYLKVFDKNYLNIWHEFDIENGLHFSTELEYEHRKQLRNNCSFYFYDADDEAYTSNIPEGIAPELVKNNKAFTILANLEYTPRHRYYVKKGVKHMSYANSNPTFGLSYRQGIKNVFDSETDFSLLEASVKQNFSIGFNDNISYKIKAGRYLSNNQMHFTDYTHFNTSKPLVMLGGDLNTFRLLDYYQFSTNNDYAEAHLEFTSDRFLLKRLPVLNNAIVIQERLFANYLTHADKKNYWEVGYGLSQIFLVLDVEVVWSFDGKHHRDTGIKLKFNL